MLLGKTNVVHRENCIKFVNNRNGISDITVGGTYICHWSLIVQETEKFVCLYALNPLTAIELNLF